MLGVQFEGWPVVTDRQEQQAPVSRGQSVHRLWLWVQTEAQVLHILTLRPYSIDFLICEMGIKAISSSRLEE